MCVGEGKGGYERTEKMNLLFIWNIRRLSAGLSSVKMFELTLLVSWHSLAYMQSILLHMLKAV